MKIHPWILKLVPQQCSTKDQKSFLCDNFNFNVIIGTQLSWEKFWSQEVRCLRLLLFVAAEMIIWGIQLVFSSKDNNYFGVRSGSKQVLSRRAAKDESWILRSEKARYCADVILITHCYSEIVCGNFCLLFMAEKWECAGWFLQLLADNFS